MHPKRLISYLTESNGHCFPFQVVSTLMTLAMWVKAVKYVQMAPLLHLTKHQEQKLKIAKHVL